jgi:hypothetical protein
VNAGGAAVLVQHAGAGVKGQGHGVGLEPQAVFPGDLAGRGAQVIQVVVAFFELVLQCHVNLLVQPHFGGRHTPLKREKRRKTGPVQLGVLLLQNRKCLARQLPQLQLLSRELFTSGGEP